MDVQGFLSQPEVGYFSMLVIGALAGWIAGRVTESRHGISPASWSASPGHSSAASWQGRYGCRCAPAVEEIFTQSPL